MVVRVGLAGSKVEGPTPSQPRATAAPPTQPTHPPQLAQHPAPLPCPSQPSCHSPGSVQSGQPGWQHLAAAGEGWGWGTGAAAPGRRRPAHPAHPPTPACPAPSCPALPQPAALPLSWVHAEWAARVAAPGSSWWGLGVGHRRRRPGPPPPRPPSPAHLSHLGRPTWQSLPTPPRCY